jgi:uncharacterized protein YecE (DUF72 family)
MKIGICGFNYKAASLFDVLEIQETFYDIVNIEKLKKWRNYNRDIELNIKALQVITHTYNRNYKKMKNFTINETNNLGSFKVNNETEKALEITLEEASVLNSKIIIFQTPSSFNPNAENIRNIIEFSSILDRKFLYGWEPRGGWYDNKDILLHVLEETKFIHVTDPFRHMSIYGEPPYYRLHGIGGKEVNYGYNYSDKDLFKLKKMINKESYVLFNNIYSTKNALRFKEIVS